MAPNGSLFGASPLPPIGDGSAGEDPELAAAIAASLGGDAARGGDGGGGGGGASAAAPVEPSGPTEAEVDAYWGMPTDEPSDGYPLKVRLLDGSTFLRKFTKSSTFMEVLSAIHHSGLNRLDPSKNYKLAAPFGGPKVSDTSATLGEAGIDRGNYTLSEAFEML